MKKIVKTNLMPGSPWNGDFLSTKNISFLKIVIYGLVTLVIFALVVVWLLQNALSKKDDRDFMTKQYTPQERVEKIVERAEDSPLRQLHPEESAYILDWVTSKEGRSVKISEDEARKIIDALNR